MPQYPLDDATIHFTYSQTQLYDHQVKNLRRVKAKVREILDERDEFRELGIVEVDFLSREVLILSYEHHLFQSVLAPRVAKADFCHSPCDLLRAVYYMHVVRNVPRHHNTLITQADVPSLVYSFLSSLLQVERDLAAAEHFHSLNDNSDL